MKCGVNSAGTRQGAALQDSPVSVHDAEFTMTRRVVFAPFALCGAVIAGLLFACRSSHPPQKTSQSHDAKAPPYSTLPPEEIGVKDYRGEGRVVRIEPDGEHITIAHRTIPGFMSAMTMTFRVRDKQMLAGLKPGDEVQFTLEVGATSAMLTAINRKKA